MIDRYKDGAELSSGGKISVTSSGDKYTLRVGDAQEADSGEYNITATSAGGQLSGTASLLVTSKHSLTR